MPRLITPAPDDFDDDPTYPGPGTAPGLEPEPPRMHPDDLRRMREVEARLDEARRRRPPPAPPSAASVAARRLVLLQRLATAVPRWLLPRALREVLAEVDAEIEMSHKMNA